MSHWRDGASVKRHAGSSPWRSRGAALAARRDRQELANGTARLLAERGLYGGSSGPSLSGPTARFMAAACARMTRLSCPVYTVGRSAAESEGEASPWWLQRAFRGLASIEGDLASLIVDSRDAEAARVPGTRNLRFLLRDSRSSWVRSRWEKPSAFAVFLRLEF